MNQQQALIDELAQKQNQLHSTQQRTELLTTNMNSLLDAIPRNHPGRPHIVQHFIQGIEKEEASQMFKMHVTRIARIQKMPRPTRLIAILAWKGSREALSPIRKGL